MIKKRIKQLAKDYDKLTGKEIYIELWSLANTMKYDNKTKQEKQEWGRGLNIKKYGWKWNQAQKEKYIKTGKKPE